MKLTTTPTAKEKDMAKASSDTLKKVADQTMNTVEERVLDGLDVTREFAQRAAEEGTELKHRSEAVAKEMSHKVSGHVQEKPLQALAIAFAAGALATFLFSRR